MRKLIEATFCVMAIALCLAVPAAAHGFKVGDLTIGHPWTRATPGGAKIGGGYLSITNNGTVADRLVGVSVSVSDRGEIHEMKMDGGVMTMRPLADGVAIKPGETVKFEPGGYHLMFMDLKEPFKEGTMVKGQLQFEKAGNVDVEYKVEAIGFTGQKSGGAMGGMEGHKH